LRRCLHCRRLIPAGRCPCRTRTARGYDNNWAGHSAQRRREQWWCADCGAVADLTVDHPTDDVVCRSCNSRRGPTTHGGRGGQ